MKPRRCANPECRKEFTPAFSTTQKVCKWQCGLAIKDANHDKARKAIASQERAEHRERKEKVKTKAQHMQEAQNSFNAYVRERDRYLPCISCGVTYPADRSNVWDAGHLRSVGASSGTRFNLFNVNKQCVRCNRYLSSNAIQYRIALVEKIGLDRVEMLYAHSSRASFSIEYLSRLKAIFRKKVRILKKIRGRKNGDDRFDNCE